MNMKITKELCRKIKIFNNYDYSNGEFYISYVPAQHGMMTRYAYWGGFQNKKSFSDHWMDYGAKVFTVSHREEKPIKFLGIVEWARTNLGITEEFVKTPFGSYMPKSFVEKRNKEIIEKYGLIVDEKEEE